MCFNYHCKPFAQIYVTPPYLLPIFSLNSLSCIMQHYKQLFCSFLVIKSLEWAN